MTTDSKTATIQLRSDAVSWREVDGEVVALDLSAGDYLAINPTGAALWQLLADGATESVLADHLADRYDIDNTRAASDVAAFIAVLDSRGLVRRSR